VTERLAINRQIKFNQSWNELLEKISELNQVFSFSLKPFDDYFEIESDERFTRNNSRM